MPSATSFETGGWWEEEHVKKIYLLFTYDKETGHVDFYDILDKKGDFNVNYEIYGSLELEKGLDGFSWVGGCGKDEVIEQRVEDEACYIQDYTDYLFSYKKQRKLRKTYFLNK